MLESSIRTVSMQCFQQVRASSVRQQILCTAQTKPTLLYSVSQKNPPCGFLKFIPKWLGIFKQFLHTYYAIISTLEYKFLFKYLQLSQSYAIVSATT